MNAISFKCLGKPLRGAVASATLVLASYGQITGQTTQINLGTQGRNVDFTSSAWTRPVKSGPGLPGTCTVGDLFFKTTAVSGQNLFGCTATNTWTQLSAAAAAGLLDPGANGVVIRTAPNTTAAVPAPAGGLVGTSDTQTLTNKSIDASELNSGTLSPSLLPAFTGDIATPAGSTVASLATVNAAPGTFGDATHPVQVIVDGKGRVTGISQVAAASGLGDPGTNGLVVRTAADITTAVAAPTGAIVGTTDTQTLTNKSIAASQLTGILALANGGNGTAAPTITAGANVAVSGTWGNYVISASAAGTPFYQSILSNGTPALQRPKFNLAAGGNVTITPSDNGSDTTTFTVAASGALGANSALSNLGAVSINTSLSAQAGADLGSPANPFHNLSLSGAGTYGLSSWSFTGTPTAARIITIPDVTDTLVTLTATQTLTNKSIDASELSSGTLSPSLLPAFTGDIATTAGSTTTSLATVNAAPGTFGDATHPVQVTVDAKGRVTGISQVAAASGLGDPGTNGLVVRTAADITTAVAAPTGAIVGTTDTQTLTNKSIAASQLTGILALANGGNGTAAPTITAGANVAVSGTWGNYVISASAAGTPFYQSFLSNGTPALQRPKFNLAAGGNVTITPSDNGSDTTTFTVAASGALGANSALSNLGAVSINTSLSAQAGADLGSPANPFHNLSLSGAGPYGLASWSFTGTPTAARIITIPDVTDTLVTLAAAQTLTNKSIASGEITGLPTFPAGAIIGSTDAQTLTNKSIDAAELTTGLLSASLLPALSGDVATTAGSAETSLATVNTTPGTFGDATHAAQLTVDAKGRITGISQLAAAGLPDPGADGLVVRTAAGVTTAVAAPVSAVVGISDSQTLTNKSMDASELNSGTLSAGRLPAFSGDVITAAGSTAASLATVNATPGTFGDAAHAVQLAVDAKGRVTGISQVSAVAGLADPGANGIVIRTAANVTTAVTAPSSAIVGATDAQTLTNKSIDASELASGVLPGSRFPALTGDIATTAGSTVTALTNVNSNPGTFGDAAHSVQVTVDGKGRVTGVSQLAITGSGGVISTGAFAALPSSCSAGALYFATDQPAGQQLYTCSSTDTWTQVVNLGGSGALAFTGGSLDINTAIVPRLAAANTFTGLTTASGGLSLLTAAAQPACSAAFRGTFWYQNNGASKDGVQVCVFNGSAFGWVSLY